jgi:hypothetical protein
VPFRSEQAAGRNKLYCTSLATLRPLFKLAGYHLGLASQPTSFGTSGYKSSRSTGSGNHGGLSGRVSGREASLLPSISRPEPSDRRKTGFNSRFLHEGEVGIRREIKWEVNLSTQFRSESEAELRSPDTWTNKHDSQLRITIHFCHLLWTVS